MLKTWILFLNTILFMKSVLRTVNLPIFIDGLGYFNSAKSTM